MPRGRWLRVFELQTSRLVTARDLIMWRNRPCVARWWLAAWMVFDMTILRGSFRRYALIVGRGLRREDGLRIFAGDAAGVDPAEAAQKCAEQKGDGSERDEIR